MAIDPLAPTSLLGGLTPEQFMSRHWQRRPLLVRQALPDAPALIEPRALFALAARDDVESRLVTHEAGRWALRSGPLPRRALPPLARSGWTLLVQGLDLHLQRAHEWLLRFRFIADARLDDLMLSYASDGGGVGPHIDAYDVFLIQVSGRRRWRIGRCARPQLREDVPLKMLAHFEPTNDWVLEPGDMLYLPPGWAHEGTAVGGDCMTASVGFRSPSLDELAPLLLSRLADEAELAPRRFRDAGHSATRSPARLPAALSRFARSAVREALADRAAVDRVFGEWLTEPKPAVVFDPAPSAPWPLRSGLCLDRRTRMAYDTRQVFINGESYRAGGRDAALVRRLADERRLGAAALRQLSAPARHLLADWLRAGWLHACQENDHA